jgi:hypothetical protein
LAADARPRVNAIATSEAAILMIRWLLTFVLFAVAITADVGNAIAPIMARRRGRSVSAVPFVGALCGAAACLVCPIEGSGKLLPVAMVFDLSVFHFARFLVRWVAGRAAKGG